MPEATQPLLWIDMEMSGLDVTRERILEVAVVITNGDLEVLAEGPELVLRQDEALLAAMDDWNREHHHASGLVERVRHSTTSEAEAEAELLAFCRPFGPPRTLPLAGNSVHQDRKFLEAYMPQLAEYVHYRNVDVSTVKELVKRWYPKDMAAVPSKRSAHRALADLHESIEELRMYRAQVFR